MGAAALAKGDLESAYVHLHRALTAFPDEGKANLLFAHTLCMLGLAKDAMDHYQRVLTADPTNSAAIHGLGKAFSAHGQVAEAIAAFRRALEHAPNSAEILNDLGIALWEIGFIQEAEQYLRRSIEIDPRFPQPWFNLHSVLLATNQFDNALACLTEHCRLQPQDVVAQVHLHVLHDYRFRLAHPTPILSSHSADSSLARACLQGYQEMVAASQHLPVLLGSPAQAFQIGLSAANARGLVLEFGVRFGTSLRQIAAMANQEVHGFDSFQGLPEVWHDEAAGSYSTQGEVPSFESNVFIHQGLFSESLPGFLETHVDPVRLIHVDCDLYSSTRTVLSLLIDRIRSGAILVFDEFIGHAGWEHDEFRAFREIALEANWSYEYLAFSVATGQAVVRIR